MKAKLEHVREFFRHDAAGGVLLCIAAALALILDNSALSSWYDALLGTPMSLRVGALAIDKPLLLWINDGLMAIFFFLVGLEIKKELLDGALSRRETALLPLIGALGGMAVPALIYFLVARGDPAALRGWAIPTATDIAFALGVLALLASRVPPSLKVFLLALAIIDDLGAIVIISLFYTADLSVLSLALAAAGIAVLAVLNRLGVNRISPYVVTGIFIWVCVLKSGVHATLAGVAVSFFIPMDVQDEDGHTMLDKAAHDLHPWVTFAILPMFAFANAGVSLAGLSVANLLAPVPLAIMLGLFVGKQVGVFGACWAAIRMGLCSLPAGASLTQLYAVALLTGIGFTMSLFIGMLAFADPARAADVRLGVLAGSILSGAAGYLLFRIAGRSGPVASDHRSTT